MCVTIRPVESSDRRQVERLVSGIPEAFTPKGIEMFLKDAKEHVALVAEQEGKISGIIVWTNSTAELEILWLAVHTDLRRQGIGHRLVKAAYDSAANQPVVIVKTAHPKGIPQSSSLSAENFESTISFFKQLGFEEVACIPDYWARDNAALILIKRLWNRHGHEDT